MNLSSPIIYITFLLALIFTPSALALEDAAKLTGTITDGSGLAYNQEIFICADDCLVTQSHNGQLGTSQYNFPENGVFDFIHPVPAGSYVFGVQHLNLQAGYGQTLNRGYLVNINNGTYMVTANYAEATRFNIVDGGGPQLNGLILALPAAATPPRSLSGRGGIAGLSFPCTGTVYTIDHAPINGILAPGSVATYQWYTGHYEQTAPILGATSSSIIPASHIAGQSISLGVTVTNTQRLTMNFSYSIGLVFDEKSNPSCRSATLNPLPKNFIESWGKKVGIAKRGKVVAISGAKATKPGVRFTYQWYVNGKSVAGVAGKRASYRIANTRSMRNKTLAVKVTANKKLFKPRATIIRFGRIR